MAVSASKQTFIQNLQQAINQLLISKGSLKDCDNQYYANGFNAGGAHAITDADVAQYNLTAADVAAGMTMAENLDKFFTNQTPAVADYQTTLQKLRTI